MDIRVASVAEAVETCKRLQKSGEATFFRGQTNDWPSIAPSLLRLRDSDRQQSIAKLEKFIDGVFGKSQKVDSWIRLP